MLRKPVRVTFFPGDVVIDAWSGDTVLDAALEHGLDIPHECGGNCTCTTCHVYVETGSEYLSNIEEPEDERLNSTPLRNEKSRLGCQALLIGSPVEVRIVFDRTGAGDA